MLYAARKISRNLYMRRYTTIYVNYVPREIYRPFPKLYYASHYRVLGNEIWFLGSASSTITAPGEIYGGRNAWLKNIWSCSDLRTSRRVASSSDSTG